MLIDQREIVRRNVQIRVGQHDEHRFVNDRGSVPTKYGSTRLEGGGPSRAFIDVHERSICDVQLRNPGSKLPQKLDEIRNGRRLGHTLGSPAVVLVV